MKRIKITRGMKIEHDYYTCFPKCCITIIGNYEICGVFALNYIIDNNAEIIRGKNWYILNIKHPLLLLSSKLCNIIAGLVSKMGLRIYYYGQCKNNNKIRKIGWYYYIFAMYKIRKHIYSDWLHLLPFDLIKSIEEWKLMVGY